MPQSTHAAEYVPEAERLRCNLRTVIDKIAAHYGLNQRSYLVMRLGTNGPQCAYNPLAVRYNADSHDHWMSLISDDWPDDAGLEWPAGIPRPPKNSVDNPIDGRKSEEK